MHCRLLHTIEIRSKRNESAVFNILLIRATNLNKIREMPTLPKCIGVTNPQTQTTHLTWVLRPTWFSNGIISIHINLIAYASPMLELTQLPCLSISHARGERRSVSGHIWLIYLKSNIHLSDPIPPNNRLGFIGFGLYGLRVNRVGWLGFLL
jgi:hypothetical protein